MPTCNTTLSVLDWCENAQMLVAISKYFNDSIGLRSFTVLSRKIAWMKNLSIIAVIKAFFFFCFLTVSMKLRWLIIPVDFFFLFFLNWNIRNWFFWLKYLNSPKLSFFIHLYILSFFFLYFCCFFFPITTSLLPSLSYLLPLINPLVSSYFYLTIISFCTFSTCHVASSFAFPSPRPSLLH